jgi:hypothetical protein
LLAQTPGDLFHSLVTRVGPIGVTVHSILFSHHTPDRAPLLVCSEAENVIVIGWLYFVQYKGIIGAPNKVRRNTCEEARPSRLDFQRDKEKIHHVIAATQDCWS